MKRSKKILLLFVFLLGVSLFVDEAFALEATTSAKTASASAQKDISSEAKSTSSTSVDPSTIQLQRQEVRSTVAQIHSKRLEMRFDFYYERLSNVSKKLETKLTLLEEAGVDTSTASGSLKIADEKLATAKKLADDTTQSFNQIVENDYQVQKQQSQQSQTLAKQAKVAFQTVVGVLKDVVDSAKELEENL